MIIIWVYCPWYYLWHTSSVTAQWQLHAKRYYNVFLYSNQVMWRVGRHIIKNTPFGRVLDLCLEAESIPHDWWCIEKRQCPILDEVLKGLKAGRRPWDYWLWVPAGKEELSRTGACAVWKKWCLHLSEMLIRLKMHNCPGCTGLRAIYHDHPHPLTINLMVLQHGYSIK